MTIGGYANALSDPEEVAHAVLHWQGTPHHHHHNDGSVAQDESQESMQHLVADGCLGGAAILLTLSLSLAPTAVLPPAISGEAAHPWLYLDGPRRPPRLLT